MTTISHQMVGRICATIHFTMKCFANVDPVPLPMPDRNIKLPLIEVTLTFVVSNQLHIILYSELFLNGNLNTFYLLQ